MPYQDGTFPSGCPVITINSVTYKANAFSYTDGTNTVNITDETGAPSGAISFAQAIAGSAELQYSASNVADPTSAALNSTTGVFTVSLNNTNTNCFITSVTVNKPKDAPWTASVSWQKKYA
jgi:hypothetical protein